MTEPPPSQPAPAAAEPRRLQRRHAVSLVLGLLIVGIGAVLMVRALSRDWQAVEASLQTADWWLLGAGTATAFVAVLLIALQWHAALAVLGHHPSRSSATRWFMAGQLGKYLPGGIWHVVGVGELARRSGVPRRPAYGSAGLSTVSLVGAGALMVTVGGAITGGEATRWWTVAVSAAMCASLFVPQLRRLLFRWAGASSPAGGSLRSVTALVAKAIPMWLTIGLATWCVSASLGSRQAIATTMVAAITSWLVGIVALPAPGGIGVREAVLVLALRDEVGTGPATAVAVTARLVFVVADFGWVPLSRLLPASTSTGPAASSTATG